jgi:hypothetical protein
MCFQNITSINYAGSLHSSQSFRKPTIYLTSGWVEYLVVTGIREGEMPAPMQSDRYFVGRAYSTLVRTWARPAHLGIVVMILMLRY